MLYLNVGRARPSQKDRNARVAHVPRHEHIGDGDGLVSGGTEGGEGDGAGTHRQRFLPDTSTVYTKDSGGAARGSRQRPTL